MRSPSSGLVMAANQTSAVDVLFDVDHDVIRQKWLFSARKYSKFFEKLQNFFCFNFRATPCSTNFNSTNQEGLRGMAGDLYLTHFCCLFWRRVYFEMRAFKTLCALFWRRVLQAALWGNYYGATKKMLPVGPACSTSKHGQKFWVTLTLRSLKQALVNKDFWCWLPEKRFF